MIRVLPQNGNNFTPIETVAVDSAATYCDGNGAGGHPRVYLHIESETGRVVCPYCSRAFVLKAGHARH